MKCELYPHHHTHAYTAVNSSQALTHYPSLSFTRPLGFRLQLDISVSLLLLLSAQEVGR